MHAHTHACPHGLQDQAPVGRAGHLCLLASPALRPGALGCSCPRRGSTLDGVDTRAGCSGAAWLEWGPPESRAASPARPGGWGQSLLERGGERGRVPPQKHRMRVTFECQANNKSFVCYKHVPDIPWEALTLKKHLLLV